MATTNPPNNGYFDLAGVFKVQDKYITDLGNSYPNVNNAPEIVGYVANLQNQMTTLAKQYQAANTSSNAVLDHQNQMIGIIDAEQLRLNEKKALIEQAEFQQQREALLNNSYRLKYAEYTKIVIIVIVSLLVFLLLQFLTSIFAAVPSGIVILLHIANFLIAFSMIIYIYATIYSRDKVNFNELNLPAPLSDGSGTFVPQDNSGNSSNSSLFGSFGICYEQSCCGEGTTWDPNSMMCLAQPGSGPAPVNTSGITGAPITPSPTPTSTATITSITSSTPTISFSPKPSQTFTSITSAAPSNTSMTTKPSPSLMPSSSPLMTTAAAPTTAAPTTAAPTTAAPTTAAPTTAAPTTAAPTTAAPTTAAPTTAAPTTAAPDGGGNGKGYNPYAGLGGLGSGGFGL
jgi:hypothetical protein